MRTLSLVGESLPEVLPVPVGALEQFVALDPRHGVFPNLVMAPILSTLWALKKEHGDASSFIAQIDELLETTRRRFNLFNKSSTKPRNPIFEIREDAEQRWHHFDKTVDLWAIFGFQTAFGLLRWVLKGERVASKSNIRSFAREFLSAALQAWTSDSNLPRVVPKNLCSQAGCLFLLCTQEDSTFAGIESMLRHAIKTVTKFPELTEDHYERFRCLVPLLHNEAYQLSPHGVGQANFVLAQDYRVNGNAHSKELYWVVMGKTLMRRLTSNLVT